VYIIDVSQSVEHDHPHASELLRKDCFNVNAFFSKARLQPMSTRQLYDFVVDEHMETDEDEEARLLEIQALVADEQDLAARAHDDAVFMGMFIPRSLTEVANVEDDARRLNTGGREEAYAQRVAGLLGGASRSGGSRQGQDLAASTEGEEDVDDEVEDDGVVSRPRPITLERLANPTSEDPDDEASESSESESDHEEERQPRTVAGCSGRLPTGEEARKAAKAAKKLAAQKAKEDRREKRKDKIKKHIKKQKTKAGKKH